MARLSVPTTASLPSTLRVEATNSTVVKTLNRLSRPSLLALALQWLSDDNVPLCPPLLIDTDSEDDDELDDDFYRPAESVEELRGLYADMQARKGSKREVVERIVEGDWRDGLSLYQLAMADLQILHDHPASLTWSAFKVQLLKTPASEDAAEDGVQVDTETLKIPRFHPSTFLRNLRAGLLSDVKAHFTFDRPKDLPILLLRIFIVESPYNNELAVSKPSDEGDGDARTFDASRTVYIAFPDASPYIYISKSQKMGPTATGESRSMLSLLLQGIPMALSRPRERYRLKATKFSSKNLTGMLHVKGAGRTNSAGGGWGIYAVDNKKDSPLNPLLPTPPLSEDSASEDAIVGSQSRKRPGHPILVDHERRMKRARAIAQARFGDSGKIEDGNGVERVDILIEDAFPNSAPEPGEEKGGGAVGGAEQVQNIRRRPGAGPPSGSDAGSQRMREWAADEDTEGGGDDWTPPIRASFHGPHVFAGIRQLVEAGIIDGERMPGWMTGEEGVTVGTVRNGRVKGFKGSGL